MTTYYRPIAQTGTPRSPDAQPLAGGWCWFDQVHVTDRAGRDDLMAVDDIPADILHRLTASRPRLAGLANTRPLLMGILNTTPDSFSDGGRFDAPDAALKHALSMVKQGADIIDIGGESTRPGAATVPIDQEILRTQPVIEQIRAHSPVPISIDTRKADVAAAAIGVGASMVNDVSALNYDAQLSEIVVKYDVPVCLMHAQGDPETMQQDPHYDDVLLDVYDHLNARIKAAEQAGIRRENIIIDPGIGFGKTLNHNLRLLQNIALFHALGCPILLGASRKRFIGTIGNASETKDRMPGSVAVALAAAVQGVQIFRVHDIAQTHQAFALWAAATAMRVQ